MIEVIKEEKDKKLVFNIHGKSHGFCNLLRKELVKDKHVKIAAYKVEHPLVDKIEMIIETDGKKSPKTALSDAVKKMKDISEELGKEFAKATKSL